MKIIMHSNTLRGPININGWEERCYPSSCSFSCSQLLYNSRAVLPDRIQMRLNYSLSTPRGIIIANNLRLVVQIYLFIKEQLLLWLVFCFFYGMNSFLLCIFHRERRLFYSKCLRLLLTTFVLLFLTIWKTRSILNIILSENTKD